MSTYDFDLFVIGGGSGGVRAARIAAGYGARVAVAEEYRYGGTCVIRGCVPKKLLVYASRFPHEFDEAAGFGWSLGERVFDWSTLIANKDQEIARLEGVYRANLDRAGVTLFDDRAVFEDPHTLRLVNADRMITAETILIATGGTPNGHMGLPGGDLTITSNEVFHLDEMPRRVVVAGGGYIAVEFAGIFNGLGAETTQVYRGPEILRGFDDDVRHHVHAQMAERGVDIVTNTVFEKVERTAGGLAVTLANGRTLEVDQALMAIGRSPNTDGLGLDKAGVDVNDKGAVIVTPYSRSTVENIYAVGDVTNRVNLTPVAIREGHAFADHVFGGLDRKADHDLIPTAVFSTPEIGTIGLSEAAARGEYPSLDIYKTDFRAMKATLSGASDRVFMKLIVDAETDRVVGAHIVGEAAGEMIQTLGVAIKMGATKADFDNTMAVHPTAGEELVTMREPTERVRP